MYVKQLELTRFKSFGSTTAIPILPGFTVVSGPNGSGKSNILDAILFALGLSSSRGMRAERLLDLVHSGSLDQSRKKIETSVSVTFALPELEGMPKEWKVSRRLRVSQSGGSEPSTTSTFYINDVPCTLSELHEQLESLRIYPNGYNVVLQGDVTGIISMNAKERRQIIDELAGVANFDRKIAQSHTKLEAVREQIDRFHLIEQELQEQSQRLMQESQKARQYQTLREQLQTLGIHQQVVTWRHLDDQVQQVQAAIAEFIRQQETLRHQQTEIQHHLVTEEARLQDLQTRIRALGEDEFLQMQSQLATRQAQRQQWEQQINAWSQEQTTSERNITQAHLQIQQAEQDLRQLQSQSQSLSEQRADLESQQTQRQDQLSDRRNHLQVLAQSADNWMKQQSLLTRQMEETRQHCAPLLQEQVRLTERIQQWQRQWHDQQQEVQRLQQEDPFNPELEPIVKAAEQEVHSLAQRLSDLQQQLHLDQATAKRLQSELHQQQRQLDKLETRQQVLQDSQGSRAVQRILTAQIPGVCGLVAQLGQVDPRYQVALEIAAGNRLNHVVVETETVAETAIELLKRDRVGRATFLPLNQLQSARPLSPLHLSGLVDFALRLVQFDPRYRDVFAFVFGQTLVFESLSAARPYIGRHRMVTLDGELLETSGAMTGGSVSGQSSLHFSAAESAEVTSLKQRIQDVEVMLTQLHQRIQTQQQEEQHLLKGIQQARQVAQHHQQQWQRQQSDQHSRQLRHQQLQASLQQLEQEQTQAKLRLQDLEGSIPPLQDRIQDLTLKLAQLEQSSMNQYWQQAQAAVQEQETLLAEVTTALRRVEQQQQQSTTQIQVNQSRILQVQERILEWQQRIEHLQRQITGQQDEIAALNVGIHTLQAEMTALESRMTDLRQLRDEQEFQVRSRQQEAQRLEWERYHAASQQQEKEALLTQLATQRQEARAVLPDPLPEVPTPLTLDDLARQIRRTEDKLRALEPVNMLAISEYEETQVRLGDLSQKLETLQQERTELLLRIENFATLRQQAFMDAFHAVDHHFKSIFAQLSDGDGYLQLENPADPLAGGLTLVAHPKGKPVRHLASMSGGEKSLTALSFIFALQRFRPSTFYAFDEVDMFLDGANVEKLASMIQQQAQAAQFIVVSLRRPMIEKADRTIGVTQARGAYTQVIGMQNRA